MPRVLTDAYRDATFCLPFSKDKGECAFVRPMTETRRNEIRRRVMQEAGHDAALAENYFLREVLREAVTGWKGFYDVKGRELSFSREMLDEICACDPDFASLMLARILSVARTGELEDQKN